MTPENQQQAQQKYQQLQSLNENIKQMQQHMQALEEQIMELNTLQDDMDSLKKVEKGSEILVPISNGIFAKAKVQDVNELIVNVGAETLVKKDIPNVKELIDKQTKELRELQEDLTEDMQNMVKQASSLESELQGLVSQ